MISLLIIGNIMQAIDETQHSTYAHVHPYIHIYTYIHTDLFFTAQNTLMYHHHHYHFYLNSDEAEAC